MEKKPSHLRCMSVHFVTRKSFVPILINTKNRNFFLKTSPFWVSMDSQHRPTFPSYRNHPIDLLYSGFYKMKALVVSGVQSLLTFERKTDRKSNAILRLNVGGNSEWLNLQIIFENCCFTENLNSSISQN